MTAPEFEAAIAATNLLPGPASTQLAIFCAWRARGRLGAIVGGVSFIVPGLAMILILSALFLTAHPPRWLEGAAAGAGAAVPAVAIQAAIALMPASWRRAGQLRSPRARWLIYLVLGGAAAATIGPYVVVVLLACGLAEVVVKRDWRREPPAATMSVGIPLLLPLGALGAIGGLAWVALKVGALSYGGGFVIIPLMQRDAVTTYHWMTGTQFLNAVALGQVTPGPVVLTVAAVGFAAAGIGGALLASLIAFAPSFVFVLVGGAHFDRLRANATIQNFLTGAGAAAIGAIAGSALPLGLAITQLWQVGVLVLGLVWLVLCRRNVVFALLGAGVLGVAAALVGLPVSP